MKILVVDDSVVIRRKIQRCVEAQGTVDILFASDGCEAIEVFKQELPELVTMDLTMPHMDGVACVKHLLTLKPDVHILVVSALSDKVTAIEAIKNGAEGFLSKPFSDQALQQALKELLSVEVCDDD